MIVPFINSVAHAQGTHSFILSIPVKSHGFAVSLTILTMKKKGLAPTTYSRISIKTKFTKINTMVL